MNKLKTVLLIDDDEATNFINKLLIDKFNITDQLLVARNGREALEVLQKCAAQEQEASKLPELILLDINMPVMDGFEFLEAYSRLLLPEKESVVIAVLTTSLNPKDMQRVNDLGITDFLNKPLNKDSLQNLMQKHYA